MIKRNIARHLSHGIYLQQWQNSQLDWHNTQSNMGQCCVHPKTNNRSDKFV